MANTVTERVMARMTTEDLRAERARVLPRVEAVVFSVHGVLDAATADRWTAINTEIERRENA